MRQHILFNDMDRVWDEKMLKRIDHANQLRSVFRINSGFFFIAAIELIINMHGHKFVHIVTDVA